MDILCVFGRGIEQIRVGGRFAWRPTRYVERLTQNNQHSGYRDQTATPGDHDERIVIAGANANVLAAAYLFSRAKRGGYPPKIVTFAAGRPRYLMPYPDVTEGGVLKERFLRVIGDTGEAEILIQADNLNTRDDLLQTLYLTRERGYGTVDIVSVELHLPRIQALLDKAVEADSSIANIAVAFHASELVLIAASPRYFKILNPVAYSAAYRRTVARERKGIEDLRNDRYDFGSQGYGFAPDYRKRL
jgi:hypothetical protein